MANLFPSALITHRTALEFRPGPRGEVFITGNSNREVSFPGLLLKFIRGPGPLPDDPPFLGVRASSQARAFLENLSTRRGSRTRVLPIEQIEARLEQLLHVSGEAELDKLRDRAREIANQLHWHKELERLDGLIGALLGTRRDKLESQVGRARAAGEPFDAACLERLQLLFAELRNPLPKVIDTFTAAEHFRNKAFFEAYFSNYIEGTRFEIEEAEAIVFDGIVPDTRPDDAHDILGTFAIVSDPNEMRRVPRTFDQLVTLIQSRHAVMLARRREASPGSFKTSPNRAGDTHFVDPSYVGGTLKKGFELYEGLEPGLPRGVFIAFLVSDVHPFVDGNGRISRIMLNAELESERQGSIIIPTVFRDDYLQALRALSRRNRPQLVIKVLASAQRFSLMEFSPYPRILAELTRRNWFREPDEARIIT